MEAQHSNSGINPLDNEDQRHLDLLSTFHYVVGGVLVLFACVPLIHFGIGIAILNGAFDNLNGADQGHPAFFGMFFALLGGIFFVFGQTVAWLTIYSGNQIKKRTNYLFSFITGCVMCIFMPFGTILGIFTIVVLSRESVKKIYGKTI